MDVEEEGGTDEQIPLDELRANDPLQALERVTLWMAAHHQYAARNRLALLAVHAVTGLLVAFLIAIDGSSRHLVVMFGAQSPVLTTADLMPAIGGGMLLLGIVANRHIWTEAVGMVVLFVWDLFMAGSFVASAIFFARDANPNTLSITYPIGVYLGLAWLIGVHLLTTIQTIRDSHALR